MIFEEQKLKELFRTTPVISLPENLKVAQIKRINTDAKTNEELLDLYYKLKEAVNKMPVGRYKQITFGRRGYLKYPRGKNKLKNEFLEKMERYTNKHWNIRERKSYLLYEEDRVDESVLFGEFERVGILETAEREKFEEDLAYFFYGTKSYPFGKPIEEWEYGFKVGDKYAIALIQYSVADKIYKYAMDFLNFIPEDFIHVLHFEPMDNLEVENKIDSAISIAQRTGMPVEMILQLKELKNQATLKKANLIKFVNILFIFANSKEEALKSAYRVKSIAPFNFAFEGNIEFETIWALTDFDFLKGKDMTGIIRHSTVDYFASLLYVSGRYNGVPKEPFIPMLNEALEPAYIPIDKSLFNIGTQGQMGSGKSVSLQYIATMFDMSIFIEKIQSDVGSYAIYCKYFDGDYIPVSLEVPVSINPLGKAYSYFTADVFDLAKALGVERPHEYFDENEINAISMLLDEEIFKKRGGNVETLSREELMKVIEGEEKAVRLYYLLQENKDFKEWKIKVSVNASKKTFIGTILMFMYRGEDEDIEGYSEVKSFIEKVLDEFYRQEFEKDPARELLISDFYSFVEKNAPDGDIKERLLARLYSFKEGGKYGHLFDKPTSIREDVDHIFFEVRFNEKEIIPIVMMTIMDYVNTTYGSVKYKDRTKLVVIDEGWFFMAIEMAKAFIDEAFRTYRKRGISIGFGTQNPKDYKTMLNYLPYIWILYLENPREAVEVYELTERDFELLKSIDKPKAYGYKYSKVYLKFKNEMGKTEKGLFILPSYPEFRWIAETDPVFKLQREEAIRKTGNLRNAIEYLAFETSN